MTPQTRGVRVNPSHEMIRLGPLVVHFLVTGEDASGSVAVFELTVPLPRSGSRLRPTATIITRRPSTASKAC